MWQPIVAATIWKIAGSAVSIKIALCINCFLQPVSVLEGLYGSSFFYS